MTSETKMLVIIGSVASVVGLVIAAKSIGQSQTVQQQPPMPGYLPVQKTADQLQAQSQNFAIASQAKLQATYLLAKYEIAREAQLSGLRKAVANG